MLKQTNSRNANEDLDHEGGSNTESEMPSDSEYTTDEISGYDGISTDDQSLLFVIPDTGWKYSTQDVNEDMPTIEEQELLSNIQDLQLKLMKVREEKVRIREDAISDVELNNYNNNGNINGTTTTTTTNDNNDDDNNNNNNNSNMNQQMPFRDNNPNNVNNMKNNANLNNDGNLNNDNNNHIISESVERSGRTIVVSNRLPVLISKDPVTGRRTIKMASGGLVTALNGVRTSMDFYWLGWVGEDIPLKERPALRQELMEEHECIPIFIPPELAQLYYSGFCNNVLWPLFHYELLPSFRPGVEKKFDRSLWKAYKKVNILFADAIKDIYEEGDVIWVHDFHLMLVPQGLRERNIESAIGWFLHVPFPSSDIYRILPVRNEILMGVLAADLIGFHTYDYARHFLSSCSRVLGLETSIKGVNLRTKRHFCTIGVHPIGIEPMHFRGILQRESTQNRILDLKKQFEGKKVLLGVDRLDYIKGMPHKLLAFELFLRHYPEFCGKVVMIQIGIPSRTQVREYRKLMGQVNELIGRINGAYGTLEYTPIHYIQRSVSTEELCACYVVADVCLVTSLRDGLNLVSHEYILMQNQRMKHYDDEDHTISNKHNTPGVLLLSEFTGAIQSLSGAMRINPWNTEAVATSIMQALTMDPALRRLQQSKLYRYVTTNTSSHWASSFLTDMSLASAKSRQERHKFSKKKPVTLKRIVQSYKRSKCRLLVINYDRVLASDTWDSQFLPPVQFVDACLRSLTADKRNIVVLYSGRDKDTLTTWFGSIPRLILGAEYGAFVKLDKTREWISLVYENIEQVKWKEAVLPIVKDFDDRTPGSEIETKEHSITWFYGDADPAFGEWQAKDMLSHLEEVLGNYPVQLVKREKALEIRALSCGQKEFLEYVIQTLFDKTAEKDTERLNNNDNINMQKHLRRRPYDFLLCSVGNSSSDKILVDYLDQLKGDSEAEFFSPADVKAYFCQSSKSGLLFGDYVFESSGDVRKLFRNLSASAAKDQQKIRAPKSKKLESTNQNRR